jgi:hypothetical protein
LLATVLLVAVGLVTVRSSPTNPTPSQLVYAQNADSTDAWLTAAGPIATELAASHPGSTSPPAWLRRSSGSRSITYVPAPRVPIEPPTITTVADSTLGSERRILLRVRAAAGAGDMSLRANGARVLSAAVDGRPIDPSRYRRRSPSWQLEYSAPPDSGFTLALTVAPGEPLSFDVVARTAGLPTLNGVRLPSRADDVVTVQLGDYTAIHRTIRLN